MKKKTIVGLISGFILAGCMTAQVRLNTPSGRPEVNIAGVIKKDISDAIINRELSKGWDLKSQSESLLVFTTKNTNIAAGLLYGSRYDSTPENRLTFTIVVSGAEVRLLVKTEIVTNPGSGFERITDVTLNSGFANQLQAVLEEIKAALEEKE